MNMEQDFELVLTSLRTNFKNKKFERLEEDVKTLTTEIEMSKRNLEERTGPVNTVMTNLKKSQVQFLQFEYFRKLIYMFNWEAYAETLSQ